MNYFRPSLSLLSFLVLAAMPVSITSCGGGGAGTASSIAIKASVQTIAYGESVSIRWGGSGLAAVRPEGTNFAVGASQIAGSLTDRPASDATYMIEARGKDGETRTASVTVHVTPSTHDLWIVGDQSQAGTPQLTEMLQALTTPLVHLSSTWPSEVPTTDVVVVLDSANLTASDQGSSVTDFLQSGGRVVFVGRSPASLATGNRDDDDISAIGAWFAGGTNLSGGFPADTAAVNPGVPMSTTLIAKSFRYVFDVQPVAASAIKLTQINDDKYGAFLYKPLSGGRVGYVGGAGAGSTPDEQIMNGLLFTAVRWAADGA